jgi:hypothetical protein
VARMRTKREGYGFLVGKPEGKRPLGRSKRRWVETVTCIARLQTDKHFATDYTHATVWKAVFSPCRDHCLATTQ